MSALLICLLSPGVVYPPPAPGAAARHRTEHRGACVDCHPKATSARAVDARLAPPRGPVAAHPALRFDHRAHAERGIPCGRCHGDDGHLPTKAECAACHDVRATERCADCHPTRPDGRLRTDLPFGRLSPRGQSAADHRGDFARRHADAARLAPESCDGCHAPPDCQACHAGRIRPIALHPADFIASHAGAARRDDPACGTCHRRQTFCVGCHAQSGLALSAPPRSFGSQAAGRTRFHPEGFAGALGGPPGPGHHRYSARRSLGACVSCHQEDDCLRCHAVGVTARLQASPHPPGFDRHCARALSANARGCVKCHGDRAALEAICR